MTHEEALEILHARARRVRTRTAIRNWEYRQRNHAKGVWFRLRRLLAEADSVWSIPEEEARRLVEEGFEPAAVGGELEPPKTLLFVPMERLLAIADRSSVPLRLGPELLAERFLALVPLDTGEAGSRYRMSRLPRPTE